MYRFVLLMPALAMKSIFDVAMLISTHVGIFPAQDLLLKV
jgi:hypothetical protein